MLIFVVFEIIICSVVSQNINVTSFDKSISASLYTKAGLLIIKGESYLKTTTINNVFQLELKNSDKVTYEIPPQCKHQNGNELQFLPTKPGNKLCVDSKNGDIYTTSWAKDVQVTKNTTINAVVYYGRNVRYNLEISFTQDVCPLEIEISNLIQPKKRAVACNGYIKRKDIRLTPGNKFPSFPVSSVMQEIVGFVFKLVDRDVRSVNIRVEIGNKNFNIVHSITDGSVLQNVTVNNNIEYKVDEDVRLSFNLGPLATEVRTLTVAYIDNWAMCDLPDRCLQNYMLFRKTIKKCNLSDSEFVGSFEKCLDVTAELSIKYHADTFRIECSYKSHLQDLIPNSNIYLLLDGKTQIEGTVNFPLRRRRRGLPPSQRPVDWDHNADYRMIGKTLQCGMFDVKRMLKPALSQTINLNLTLPFFLPLKTKEIKINVGTILSLPWCNFINPIKIQKYQKEDAFWLKDDTQRINVTGDANRNGEELIFPSKTYVAATLDHKGAYRCGVYLRKQMTKPVYSEPFVVYIKPMEVSKPVVKFRNMTLTCTFQSNRQVTHPYTYWLHNGKYRIVMTTMPEPTRSILGRGARGRGARRGFADALEREDERLIGQNTFKSTRIIRKYEDSGTYRCVVFDNGTMLKEVVSEEYQLPHFPGPKFTSGPNVTFTDSDIKLGSSVMISGCNYWRNFPLNGESVYFLKNGHQTIRTKYSPDLLLFLQLKLQDIGYYQCVLDVPGYKLKLTPSVSVQLPNTLTTKIKIKLKDWKAGYRNRSSDEFKNLNRTLNRELSGSLKTKDLYVDILRLTENDHIVDVMIHRLSATPTCATGPPLNADMFKRLNVLSVQSKSLDCCPPEKIGDELFKGKYTFPRTRFNAVARLDCVYNAGSVTRKCTGNIEKGAYWEKEDLSSCKAKLKTTQDLIQLSDVAICLPPILTESCEPVTEVAKNLTEKVSDLKIYQDVSITAHILTKVGKALTGLPQSDATEIKKVFTSILKTLDSILEVNQTLITKAQVKEKSSTKILHTLKTLTKVAKSLLKNNKVDSIRISHPNIAFYMKTAKRGPLAFYALPAANNTVGISTTTDFQLNDKHLAAIQIPGEAFSNEEDIVHSYFFKQDSLFLTKRQILIEMGKQPKGGLVVQSNILSATVGDSKVKNLTTPVVMTFKRTNHLQTSGSDVCHFWKPQQETIIKGVFGTWSDDGCKIYKNNLNNKNFSSCACNHLTNFALLLDINQDARNPLELQIITWIGCGVSLAGLFLTLFTYSFFENLRQKLPPKILMCLCVSLIGLLLTFLIGAERTSPRIGCQFVAGIIHFFMLSTFFWMLVEAVNLYKSFVTIFNKSKGTQSFLRKAYLFAWGVPLVIVAITAGVRPEDLGDDKICVVRGHPFFIAVLAPVCLILLINFFVLIRTIYSLTHRGKALEQKDRVDYIRHARIALACATLLGLSWAFGVLAVAHLSVVFQWVFCITTSLQGLFIFIFYTVRNPDVQVEWTKCLRKRSHSEIPSTLGTPGVELKHRTNTSNA